jgi:hypothetical protein
MQFFSIDLKTAFSVGEENTNIKRDAVDPGVQNGKPNYQEMVQTISRSEYLSSEYCPSDLGAMS